MTTPAPVIIEGHECSTYCNMETGIHCEVFYTNTENTVLTRHKLGQLFEKEYGLQVVDVEPAREAEPIEELAGEDLKTYHVGITGKIASGIGRILGAPRNPGHAWLAYFGTPDDVDEYWTEQIRTVDPSQE